MTDIQAGLGLAQLNRYPGLLARRRELVALYEKYLAKQNLSILTHYQDTQGKSTANEDDAVARANTSQMSSSGHLMLVRLNGHTRNFRDRVIELMAEAGVATNVHYKPLPMLSAYKNLGFAIEDFPQAKAQFENEITLPLHTHLSNEDIQYVCSQLETAQNKAEQEGFN